MGAMRAAAQDSALLLARDRTHAEAESPLEQEVVALFDQLRAPLLRYAINFGLTVQDGEEIVQETFLALFRHVQQGKSRENLRGWVFRVAHNLSLKRRTSPALASPALDADITLLADSAPDPEASATGAQQQRHLLAAFRALPEQDRRCLTLRAEGLRYREIAQTLGMSLGAVSMSLSRSLARLARASER